MNRLLKFGRATLASAAVLAPVILASGCAKHQQRPMITAVGLSPGNQCEPPGIPYYLPKPLLVVAKNVRHIDESKVGLTGPVPIPGGFDNQAAYADLKANVTVPPGAAGEGKAAAGIPAANVPNAKLSEATAAEQFERSIEPESLMPESTDEFDGGVELDSFFTYQVIFVPDLSQKYGLQISGGAGEFRAAMNMVNGWMYTGMGPFYMKDSSSAQNAMATGVGAMYAGRGVADVVSSVGDLASEFTGLADRESALTEEEQMELNAQVKALDALSKMAPKVPQEMLNFAEVYIYEPQLLPDQTTEWRLVAEHHFNRHYLASTGSKDLTETRKKLLKKMINGIIVGAEAGRTLTDSSDRRRTERASDAAGGTEETRGRESATTGDSQLDRDRGEELLKGSGESTETEKYNPPRSSEVLPSPTQETSIEFNMLPSTEGPDRRDQGGTTRLPRLFNKHRRAAEDPKIQTRVGNREFISK